MTYPSVFKPLNVAGDPNLGERENCGGFTLTRSRDAGKWFDSPCDSRKRYICERDF